MRGKAPETYRYVAGYGITPAYAGKRATAQIFRNLYGDHPRVCGEKYFTIRDKVAKKGSPPRMRGKALGAPMLAADAGITPAYAGKRGWQHSTMKPARDHPRVCGEKQRAKPKLHER